MMLENEAGETIDACDLTVCSLNAHALVMARGVTHFQLTSFNTFRLKSVMRNSQLDVKTEQNTDLGPELLGRPHYM